MKTISAFALICLVAIGRVIAQPMHGRYSGWGWDHMMGWGGGVAMWIALLAVIGLVVYLAVRGTGQSGQREQPPETALSILQKRYARGDITKQEFEEKRRDLGV
jgi:putative membrane protein